MRASPGFQIAFLALVCLAGLLLPGDRAAAGEAEGGQASAAVLVEVWRVTDADLVGELDRLTENAPGNAEAVRARLGQAGDLAVRASRFLTPTTLGTSVRHSDRQKIPTVAHTTTSGGAVRGGFGGYVEAGTTLEMICTLGDAGQIRVALDLRASGAEKRRTTVEQPGGISHPPGQWVAEVQGHVLAPSGVFRVFQSSARQHDTIFVFVRPSLL